MSWRWLSETLLLAIHEEQLVEHGGATGVRDHGLLQTALAKPQQLAAYGEPPPDAAALAAAYGYGIAHLHPFIDGNKRSALVATESFLMLNGLVLGADDFACVDVFLALAAGELSEAELAIWIRRELQG